MALLHLSLHPPLLSSSRPRTRTRPKPEYGPDRPARDRVIDFGKHKGKMLGSLPSDYLRWASRTLRARDTQHWARLADLVLADPVYADRLQWESAHHLLAGGDAPTAAAAAAFRSDSPADDLLELAARFEWDLADRAGWARLDFDLLGTSHGGRIPRLRTNVGEERRGTSKDGILETKVGFLNDGCRCVVEERGEEVVRSRREERREKRRIKRGPQLEMLRREVGVEEETNRSSDGGVFAKGVLGNGQVVNPFPGRQALLEKISSRRPRD